MLLEDLVIQDPSKSHMMRSKQKIVTSKWMALLPLVCLKQWMMDLFNEFLGNIQKFQRQKKTWSAIFKMLHDIFETLSQREDFTDQEIDELQVEIESFSVKWLELTGCDGIYNYIHMMITGHIIYYLRKWRNYYCYENEGWEHTHAQMAWFHHNRTQRGGSAGRDSNVASSKGKPIGLWLLRRLFWSTIKAIPEETRLELNRKTKEKGVSTEDEFVEAESEEEEIEE
jgi:hypothetical protein